MKMNKSTQYAVKLILLAFAVLLSVSGCGVLDDDEQSHVTLIGNSNSNNGIHVPGAIRIATDADPAQLSGTVTVDGGQPHPLTISSDGISATIEISNLLPGEHEFVIAFFYDIGEGVQVTLAQAVKNVSLEPGSNALNFIDSDYRFDFDNDQDQVNNLEEIVAGTDPNDDVCVVGVSKIGACTLDS